VSQVYEGLFGELRNEDYWSPYTGQKLRPNPQMKRTSKGIPKSSRIRTKIDLREQYDRSKKCSYYQTLEHTKRTCPNNVGASTSHC